MANIHPFRGILFNTATDNNDITSLIAPPYDVIKTAEQRADLIERHRNNITNLILPEPADGLDRYEKAGESTVQWRRDGVLVQADRPILYVWEQVYEHAGVSYTRRAVVAKVDAKDYGKGGVLRHEFTHKGPKADRLRLFQTTGMQFSQLFGIFPDANSQVSELLEAVARTQPIRTAKGDDGHGSKLFEVTDADLIDQLINALKGLSIAMADGHHRYETSVAYYEQAGHDGTTLMTLVPASDKGLLVLPTHRVLSRVFGPAEWDRVAGGGLSIDTFKADVWTSVYADFEASGSPGVLVVEPDQDRVTWIKPSAASEQDQWLSGDVGILHDHVLPNLGADISGQGLEDIDYHHAADAAVEAARINGGSAFLLKPLKVEELLKIVEQGLVLPPKSTFFYPKFLSGFINAELD